MSDYFNTRKDSCLMADRLELATGAMAIEAQTLRPIWIDVNVPQSAVSGKYKGTLSAVCDGEEFNIPFQVEVGKRTLPNPPNGNSILTFGRTPTLWHATTMYPFGARNTSTLCVPS